MTLDQKRVDAMAVAYQQIIVGLARDCSVYAAQNASLQHANEELAARLAEHEKGNE